MSVLIKGLEIPPKGKGVVVILCSSGAVYSGGQKVGTAVPVPPHGRLGDLEYAKEHIRACLENGRPMYSPELHEVLALLDDVPTIIPA